MRNFIWTLDPEVDSFLDFAVHMKDYGDQFFSKKDISFWVDGITESMQNVRLPMQWRRQFTYIFKEAINSLHKFVTCENVTIDFKLQGESYQIVLKTDGAVISDNNEFMENTLALMQKRSDKIAATIKSKIDKTGLQIELRGAIPGSAATSDPAL